MCRADEELRDDFSQEHPMGIDDDDEEYDDLSERNNAR